MDVAGIATELRAGLDRAALVDTVATWVSLESPSHDRDASAVIADAVARHWSGLGVVTLTADAAGTHLLIDVPGAGELAAAAPILLLGHSDTVWPIGTLAGPLPLRIEDGVLRGPGSYDMKAGLVVMHAAIAGLRAIGLPQRPVRILIAADEEVGSAASTPLVRDACRGVAAVLGFESPHPDGALKVGRLGSTRLRLRVTGREAHAALDPDAGISAIDELTDQLLVLRAAVAEVQARRPGEVLVNVGAISGGGRTNVVPATAEALIGIRFATAAAQREVDAIFAALAPRRPGALLDTEMLSSRPAWQASASDAALLAEVNALAEGAGLAAGGRPAAGAADTNTTGALGVPTLDGFGPRGGGAHALSEHIVIDSLLDRVVLLGLILARPS